MLNELPRIKEKRKTVGRGGARGGTSGKGHKGQKARSGGFVKAQFEGGQTPLTRRLPRRGFNNSNFKIQYTVLSLRNIEEVAQKNNMFVIDKKWLVEQGMIKNVQEKVKVLANGGCSVAMQISVDECSKSAEEAIVASGFTLTILK